MEKPQIQFSDFSFTYAGADSPSLRNVSFSVRKGEFILLTGKSGCGKTTLTRCINGLIPDSFEGSFSGTCRVCGLELGRQETGDLAPLTGSVFQDPRSQFFTLQVKTELPFPSENMGRPRQVMQKDYERILQEFSLEQLENRSIFDLSSGEKQKVAIASVSMADPGIYVLDEPSANLDRDGTVQLRKLLQQLRRRGSTVILSEHKLWYLQGLADRVLLMEEGKISSELTGREFESREAGFYDRLGLRQCDLARVPLEAREGPLGPEVLSAEGLSFGYSGGPILWQDARFSSRAGEIVGILGSNGCGKSTLIRVLMGLQRPRSGKICIREKYAGKLMRRKKSFYVMQDVDYQLFAPTVLEEMLTGMEKTPAQRQRAEEILEKFGLRDLEGRHPTALSGGQKQRLSLALAEMSGRPVLYLDEPTSGLDGENMKAVRRELGNLAAAGACIYVITHDYEFASGLFSSVLLIGEDRRVRYIPPEAYEPEMLRTYFDIPKECFDYE